MENEIKVNEFIRTKYGEIAKVIEYKDEIVLDKEIKFYGMYRGYICEDEIDFIVKHSPNLIDIIEVNDIAIMSYNGIVFQKFVSRDDIVALKLKEYKLLEILTKEQFESISYKVKEKK